MPPRTFGCRPAGRLGSSPGGGLRDAVRGWAAAPAGDDQYRNPDLVRQQLAARKLQGRSAIEAYSRIAIASP